MQSSNSFPDLEDKLVDDFSGKLRVHVGEVAQATHNKVEKISDDDEGEEEEEDDFTFACTNPDSSPISAEDVFQDGQIRPVFPLFDTSLLLSDKPSSSSPIKKLFVEAHESNAVSSSSESEGPFCEWRGKAVEVTASPDTCKKSNSTGFCKLWRFREVKLRSNSDGKDAFVFLNKNEINKAPRRTAEMKEEKKTKGGRRVRVSAHEKHYVKSRAMKEEVKRKSYLPYRHVGFFTNVNEMSRNILPF